MHVAVEFTAYQQLLSATPGFSHAAGTALLCVWAAAPRRMRTPKSCQPGLNVVQLYLAFESAAPQQFVGATPGCSHTAGTALLYVWAATAVAQ